MSDVLTSGSLQAEVTKTGLIKLTITAMKNGQPVSFVDLDSIRKIVHFAESKLLDDVEPEDDDIDIEDLL